MKSDLLDRWMVFWNDERLKQLTRQVWQRLPAHDRATLRALLLEVSDGEPHSENALATAELAHPDTMQEGSAANVAKDVPHLVRLGKVREIEDDDAARFVIAHEFAHIVLRHPEMTIVVANLLGFKPDPIYSEDDKDSLHDWHEDHADLQAWLWGFETGMQACRIAYPESRRARWDVTLEFEDVTHSTGADHHG